MMTPTPAEEEEHLRTHPYVRGVYPKPDHMLTERDIYELGTKYAKKLRHAGQIGLILTFAVSIFTFLPFEPLPISNKSPNMVVAGVAFIIILWILRFVEKGTWPFKKKKDEG
jgi:hypothetical protein